MADRVTPAEVIEILGASSTVTLLTVVPYITSANVLVTSAFASTTLTDAVLKEIERWLSAHMATVTKDRLSKEEGAGGAYIKWAGKWEDELSSTEFGQMVLLLDTTNTFRNLKAGKRQAWLYGVEGV